MTKGQRTIAARFGMATDQSPSHRRSYLETKLSWIGSRRPFQLATHASLQSPIVRPLWATVGAFRSTGRPVMGHDQLITPPKARRRSAEPGPGRAARSRFPLADRVRVRVGGPEELAEHPSGRRRMRPKRAEAGRWRGISLTESGRASSTLRPSRRHHRRWRRRCS